MGSQFVDFNADGRIDYVTATFDGSPHVALGTADGFAEPERILDTSGRRVMLDQYWDYDAKQWKNTGGENRHCTSAVVFDWDADGDYDLLLGDYSRGELWLQRNEGKPGEPAFTGKNEPVLAGGKPFGLEGGMTAPRLVDWDGDGKMDIVAGSYGSAYDAEPPGGVYWFRNVGQKGAPEFAAAQALVAPTKTTGTEADRPNVGLYADPVDYDGDGDLDLVVGGYSIWTPKKPKLTEEQRARLVEIKAELGELMKQQQGFFATVREQTKGLDKDEAREVSQKLYSTDDYRAVSKTASALRKEQAKLEPKQQRKASVWVYLRKPAAAAPGGSR